eukprot:CAMPEP_0119380174 /NCGR_PEP_ID=MMETSP1334-20130426/55842_1 /TAXON_ID=127549 /ORGANISM="Calcidiscus leptoporus, Strain RCC1130" /LENGTH=375 /DNA_ID=CAMNT_0007399911 /DNA_START=392 /DNA_END=1520 /DNA_ORIENTATION=-
MCVGVRFVGVWDLKKLDPCAKGRAQARVLEVNAPGRRFDEAALLRLALLLVVRSEPVALAAVRAVVEHEHWPVDLRAALPAALYDTRGCNCAEATSFPKDVNDVRDGESFSEICFPCSSWFNAAATTAAAVPPLPFLFAAPADAYASPYHNQPRCRQAARFRKPVVAPQACGGSIVELEVSLLHSEVAEPTTPAVVSVRSLDDDDSSSEPELVGAGVPPVGHSASIGECSCASACSLCEATVGRSSIASPASHLLARFESWSCAVSRIAELIRAVAELFMATLEMLAFKPSLKLSCEPITFSTAFNLEASSRDSRSQPFRSARSEPEPVEERFSNSDSRKARSAGCSAVGGRSRKELVRMTITLAWVGSAVEPLA